MQEFKIPLVDLSLQHKKLKKQIYDSFDEIVESNKFIMGPAVEEFEKEFARFCKTKYAVGVGNGTVSLHAALVALGVGQGDEVITVPNTFIATAEGIPQTGARIVFCDIDPQTHTMDPESLKDKITSRTKAIIPVHIHGNPCQMDEILKIAKKCSLYVVEDAAQAHGASFKNKLVGNWGDIASFSFFPAKNLGAWGDAGGLVTNNKKLYEKLKALVNHGRREKYVHDFEGFNYRLDTIQAAVLRIKLVHLKKWNSLRHAHAKLYRKLFKEIPDIECIEEMPNGVSSYHLFVICHPDRDKIKEHLLKFGIETGVHYPIPLHLQPAFRYLGYKKGDLPIAEEKSEQILSLPMYPELTDQQIKSVVKHVIEAIS